ncbi:MAG: hypothetical protein EXR69_07095 [Myxococcales bacterium]|nr:hypothetical protein [Myxococcales bacterium]
MPVYVLGISALYHDAAAVILCDGVIIGAAQEERFSRLKHDASLPIRAAAWCLKKAGITAADLTYLVFYEKPLRKFERILATSVATFPKSWGAFPRQMRTWLGDKLWLRGTLCAAFGVRPDRVLFCEHHLSHAASAFYASPHTEAAVLAVDGVGEWATTTLWRGSGTSLTPISEVRFPHSLGMLYSTITAHLGFAVNEGEYKVMGMAAYGQPRFRAELDRLLKLDPSGGYALDLDYFSFHWHPTRSGTPALEALLGPGRFPGAPFTPEGGAAGGAARAESQRWADLAASAQAQIEDAMLHLVRHAKAAVGTDALCLAGGVALNSVANRRIAQEGPFAHLWVQPAAGDAGGAMGAAMWVWHAVLGHPRQPGLARADLGRSIPVDRAREMLTDLGAKFEAVDDPPASAAADLADGKVIGWVEGGDEWGPRALGHRSILADPRSAETKEHVNSRVKYRELFRPFAPSVTAADADSWFDIPAAAQEPACWMLTTAAVRPEKQATIPAVVHVDGSARVQVVRPTASPVFHQLVSEFGRLTGVPIVLNTSFNLKGEPMVSCTVDAMASFVRSGLDVMYVDGLRVERPK